MTIARSIILAAAVLGGLVRGVAGQEMPEGWSKGISGNAGRPDTRWFTDAKFGIFMHWGLYSEAGNEWNGKRYYGSGEWLMNRAKVPVGEYEKLAGRFDPSGFDADQWARFVKEAGAKYLVITAKHHEGFAMYGSKVSGFNIVDATPYGKDPMAPLAEACRREGVKFGFYYSQFLDWHERDGGGNKWDFKGEKDYKKYYAEKSMPQIRELASGYGPLGVLWFDMPGGLTREETGAFVGEVRKLQPQCLISSRVGQGLGDFKDLGDSELPATPVDGPWEALFTHTDSWGFVKSDKNFKTPREVVRLLAATAARGGNLLLNVGPNGKGRIPEKSVEYLREVGKWLAVNGESIYGTARSPFPDQPWGVATTKPGTLYLHVLDRPRDGEVYVPRFGGEVKRVALLQGGKELKGRREEEALVVSLPADPGEAYDDVVVVEYVGTLADTWQDVPAIVSRQYETFAIDASAARVTGAAKIESKTHSRYFGNWKHDTCVTGMKEPGDRAEFGVRFVEPGDYRVSIEYACPEESKGREGVVEVGGKPFTTFETLYTLKYDSHQPIVFVRHVVGIVTVEKAGEVKVAVAPKDAGAALFWLRRVIVEPVR